MPQTRNSRGRFSKPAPPLDVRSKDQIEKLEELLKGPRVTFVLVYADWCGHCHKFMPTWSNYEKLPSRTANIAKVHHDMQEESPTLRNASILGYPSVVRVLPSGKIAEFVSPGSSEPTNAMPPADMRNAEYMKKQLTSPANAQFTNRAETLEPSVRPSESGPSTQRMTMPRSLASSTYQEPPPEDTGEAGDQGLLQSVTEVAAKNAAIQRGGALAGAVVSAIQAVGPVGLLAAAHSLLTRRRRRASTYRSPKRGSRRGSTRRNRRA